VRRFEGRNKRVICSVGVADIIIMDIATVDQFVQLPHELLQRLCRSIDDILSSPRDGDGTPPARVIQEARRAVEDGKYFSIHFPLESVG
jgi:hypothetical protein